MDKAEYPRIDSEQFPIRVCVHHRVVPAIGVAVESLGGERILHLRVGGEETADDRVVEAGIRVDDTETVVMLVAGEPAAELEVAAVLHGCPIGSRHAVSPRVEVAALHDGAVSSNNAVPTAQLVGLHIIEAVGIGGGVMYA